MNDRESTIIAVISDVQKQAISQVWTKVLSDVYWDIRETHMGKTRGVDVSVRLILLFPIVQKLKEL